MPSTASEVGLDDPFDPLKALPASARYLRRLRSEFGNIGLAAAAYNAGSGRIQKWLAGQAELPQETRNYVRKITGASAENWTDQSNTVLLRLELPSGAPCENVRGLSRTNDPASIRVALAPSIINLLWKAKVEALRRVAKKTSKKRLARDNGKRGRELPKGMARATARVRLASAGKS